MYLKFVVLQNDVIYHPKHKQKKIKELNFFILYLHQDM
jgi:hypothetical protein